MNRIILIGNGFDLAHGMPTSYKDFIEDYWGNIIDKVHDSRKVYEDECVYFSTDIQTLAHLVSKNTEHSIQDIQKQISSFKNSLYGVKAKIKFNMLNKFLENISKLSSINNWVDIENEYYKFLSNFINPHADYLCKISQLNSDFSKIKELLESYLLMVVENSNIHKNSNIEAIINSEFELRDFTETGFDEIIKAEYDKIQNLGKEDWDKLGISPLTMKEINLYNNLDWDKFKKQLSRPSVAKNHFNLSPNNTLFLNFNYTTTEKLYLNYNTGNQDVIHIHGELGNSKNPIIFGYGDELGKEYFEIENLNDNSYLENIKSIKYLDTDNYKKTLNFIESDKYQIFVLGHSCGNSDRTLLNTLFEHDNCVSIKVFYHKKDDGTDNYSDVIRNISRNFNSKSSMRNKVVNKMYCEPLTI